MKTLDSGKTEALKRHFRGEIITPNDKGYESSRQIWNGMFDRKPAIIAQCIGTSDVISAVNFARDNNLLTAVKEGGTTRPETPFVTMAS